MSNPSFLSPFKVILLLACLTTRLAAQVGPPPPPPGSDFPLNSWTLGGPPWSSDFGDPALGYAGLNVQPGWSDAGTCLSVETNTIAYLNEPVFEPAYNWTNISVESSNGSLSFWYQANYTSVADGGNGPQTWAALINIGAFTSNASVGDWLIAIDPPASNILFLTASNGSSQVVFKYPIDIDAGDFWQIAVGWSETNTALYLNGQWATNAPPVLYRPTVSECSNYGFFIGSLGTNGQGQALGQFQNLVSYGYPITAEEMAQDYASDSAAILASGGTIPGGGGRFHADGAPAPPGGGGSGSGGGGGGPEYSIPSYSFTSNYLNYSNFWIVATNSPSQCFVSLDSTLSNLTYQIWTNSALNTTNWSLWQTLLATNSITLAPPLDISTNNSLFFEATLDWSTTGSGIPDWWSMYYFNALVNSNADFDGSDYTVLYDYQNGIDPNVIGFNLTATNQFVSSGSVPMQTTVTAGIPSYMATLVDSTNYAGASWLPYNSNLTVSVGTNQGWHQIWVGLRGLPPTAQQTWAWYRVKLDTTPPLLVITNPSSSTVMQPMIEVQGYCPEALASLSYDLSNATGLITNQPAFVLNQNYTTNTWEFTTNTFQAFDVPLTNGANTFTFHATDLAGNVTTTNFTYTLSYAGRTNPPVVQFYWPQNGTQISGNSFTARGSLDDFTTSLQATIVDTNGDTNTITAIIERNGNFWIENLPLALGSNELTLTATDVASNVTTTNITVIGSSLTLTMTAVETNQLWQMTENVSGTISDASGYSVWVNGVEATNGSGTWGATNVPVTVGGTAAFQVRAIANSDNGGNGSGGGGTPTYADMGNPTSASAIDFETSQDRPARLYGSQYSMNLNTTVSTIGYEGWYFGYQTNSLNTVQNTVWNDGSVGVETIAEVDTNSFYGTGTSLYQWNWPASYWTDSVFGPFSDVVFQNGSCEYSNSAIQSMDVAFPEEHCDVNFPTNYDSVLPTVTEINSTYIRTAQLAMQLYSGGGKSVPGVQSLYLITCPVTDMLSTNPIPPQSVSIGSLGKLDTNGNLWVALPAGDPDVTPLTLLTTYFLFTDENVEQFTPIWLCSATIPSNRNRTTIGVGEQVGLGFLQDLPINTAVSWTLTGGGSLDANTGIQVLFTAPSNKASVTITAKIGNTTVPFPIFTVVEPSSLTCQFVSSNAISFPSGVQGVGFTNIYTVFPTNVSFYRVAILEFSNSASVVTGYFTNMAASNQVHYAGTNWQTLTPANRTTDIVKFELLPQPWYPGEMDWNVPVAWQVTNSTTTNTFGATVLMKYIINSTDGTSTAVKGTAQTTRTP